MKRLLTPEGIVRLLTIWALLLTVLPFVNLLLLTQSTELYDNQYGNQLQVWFIFVLQTVFGLTFAASTYGLWQYNNWGRVIFLWATAIWFSVNFLALFVPLLLFSGVQQNPTAVILNGLRFAVAFIIPLWYLNQPRIKAVFFQTVEISKSD